jgi:hypothetical protein
VSDYQPTYTRAAAIEPVDGGEHLSRADGIQLPGGALEAIEDDEFV